MTIAKGLLAEIDHENASTRKLIDLIPDSKFGWRPHPKSWTIGELATHLANLPTWAARTLDASELDLAPIFGKTFKVPEKWGRLDVLALFDANWKAAREGLAKASDERLMQLWTLRKGDAVLAKLPRIAALRSFIMSHSIHHRGQLTVYLRLVDVPLPNVYGPTADVSI